MARLRTARTKTAAWLREHAVDVGLFGGLAAVAVGFGLIYLPAGVIVGGAIASTLAWKLASAPASEGPAARVIERWYTHPDQEDEE